MSQRQVEAEAKLRTPTCDRERVLVSGGDGSVMETADALAGTGVALAVLPGGTGNLLALNLELSAETGAAVELAVTGHARPLDVGVRTDASSSSWPASDWTRA